MIDLDKMAKTIELRLQKFGHSRAFHIDELNSLVKNMKVELDKGPQYYDELLVRCFADIYTQKLKSDTVTLSVSTPADWWEHFKIRWFPAWAKRRWPPLMRTKQKSYRFDWHAWYPGLDLIPDQPVRYIHKLDLVLPDQLADSAHKPDWMEDYMPNEEFWSS